MLVLALILVALPATGTADETLTWYLTGRTTDLPDHGIEDGQIMGPELAGTESEARFSSVGGLPVPTEDQPVRAVSWYSEEPWALDMEVIQDATVVLFFQASVQVSATANVDLVALSPDGGATVASDSRVVSIDSNAPSSFEFQLAARDQVLPEGSLLQLTVTLEGPSVATVVLYDSEDNPSRLEALRVRPLDSDGDGVPDSLERAAGTDPLDGDDPGDGAYDRDQDGLADSAETALGTDPLVPDSDGDGWLDGAERTLGTDPMDPRDAPDDADGDGLADAYEAKATTDPSRADTDGDGIDDCAADDDEDGLSNCQEQAYGTDPLRQDSDGDGVSDGDEVAAGTDPAVHRSPPAARVADRAEIISAIVMLAAGLGLATVGLARRHRL